MRATFYDQQASNRRLSLLLMLSVALLLAALGFTIGFAYTGDPIGGVAFTVIALILGIVMSITSYYSGDAIVLRASGATPADPVEHQQLLNVVQEMSIAANLPMTSGSTRISPDFSTPEPVIKGTGREDVDPLKSAQGEKLLVSGDKARSATGDRRAQNRQVVLVAECAARHRSRLHDLAARPQECAHGLGLGLRCLELPGKVPRHLVEDVLRQDHGVVSIDDLQQSLAEPVRGETRQQHVRVEDHPHETALKMSSSVTKP